MFELNDADLIILIIAVGNISRERVEGFYLSDFGNTLDKEQSLYTKLEAFPSTYFDLLFHNEGVAEVTLYDRLIKEATERGLIECNN